MATSSIVTLEPRKIRAVRRLQSRMHQVPETWSTSGSMNGESESTTSDCTGRGRRITSKRSFSPEQKTASPWAPSVGRSPLKNSRTRSKSARRERFAVPPSTSLSFFSPSSSSERIADARAGGVANSVGSRFR